ADADRERERDDDEAANELSSPEGLKQEERERRPEEALEHGGDQREADTVAERDVEHVALERGPEVLQSDEARAVVADIRIAHRQIEREHEWGPDEEEHVEDGRGEQEVAEREPSGRLARKPSTRARATGDRDGGGPRACRSRAAARRGYCHALCLA